ncbi:ATP-binding protein [Rhodoferax sp.]|uniref:ATP-binding protein n=1 Tax=Rhodoferax sp. TaxID=50421 RepID=UPI00262D0B6C|nr:ATP-binding protein [Rhodoferax sp.]MDD2925088.1 ATP-binding protein [Rhodoferax sp.]
MNWPHWQLRALPSSLYARVALILLAGLLVAQGVSLWLQWDERSSVVTQARATGFAERIARTVRVLETVGVTQLDMALPALQDDDLSVAKVAPGQVSPNPPRGVIGHMLAAQLGSQRDIRHVDLATGSPADTLQRSFDVRLQSGQWVRITVRRAAEAAPPALSNDLIAQLLATLVIVTAVVMIAVRQATLPLQQLARAADALGSDLDAPPLPTQGSSETRSATQAFNRMQTRIKRLVNERARALASVSHDLRTPLTRLRLRAELVSDDTLRDQMAADLEAMATMLDATLDYLRGLQDQEPVRPIDINALLESMAEDARVLGRSISLSGQAHSPFTARLSALRRALQNLIDNAFKYGQQVSIDVQDSTAQLRITVQDDGPGIAPAELAKVTEPYYRVDSARSQHGGVGLGLSIARDIALLHDGELSLHNRPQGGLAATLCLPRS